MNSLEIVNMYLICGKLAEDLSLKIEVQYSGFSLFNEEMGLLGKFTDIIHLYYYLLGYGTVD